jgi:hypothetical protein
MMTSAARGNITSELAFSICEDFEDAPCTRKVLEIPEARELPSTVEINISNMDPFESCGLGKVVDRARKFAVANWPTKQPKVKDFKINSGLVKGCPSMQRFDRGVETLTGSRTDKALRDAVLDKGDRTKYIYL